MSDFDRQFEAHRPAFAEIESIVRAAGTYVRPSDDLRPSTLEAVRDACRQHRRGRRLVGLAFLVMLFAATGFPESLLTRHTSLAYVQSSELYRRAVESATDSRIGANWALYEVFSDLRREKAERLDRSN